MIPGPMFFPVLGFITGSIALAALVAMWILAHL
jgi:hypothetical protein